MTGQHTLEDVGVKRTRPDENKESASRDKTASQNQPQSKKAHTEEPGGQKHNKDSVQSKSKENKGLSSNAAPEPKSVTKEKTASEPKPPSDEAPNAESEKDDVKTDESAKAAGDANPKEPLSDAVAKPEGQHNTQFESCTLPSSANPPAPKVCSILLQ